MSDLLVKCSVCKALIDEEDLFCANCGTEAPLREESDRPTTRTTTHNFQCTGCGASMSYEAKAGTLRCPFCGSERLDRQKDAKVLSPKWVLPFAVRREEAVAAMREFLGRGFFRPRDLSEQALVVKMSAVYVPYWVFQATTHTYWTADTDDLPFHARGDWRPLAGEHRGRHANLLVGASGALSPDETASICPFDMSTRTEPAEVDLENVTVEQFSVMRKYARPLARRGLEYLEAQACDDRYVPGRSRNLHVNTRIEGLSSEPVLLPVWIMAYRYRDKLYRFLVNGQTGKAAGDAPQSWLKMLAVGVAAALGILLLLLILAAVFSG